MEEYLLNYLRDNLIKYAIKYASSLLSRITHSLKTYEIDDFSNLVEQVLSGTIREGNCIESIGQFSLFGHVFSPPGEIPIIGEPDYKITTYNLVNSLGITLHIPHPISSIPTLPKEDLQVGFVYRGQFDSFFAYGNPKNQIILSGLPIISKKPLWEFTEKFIDFNLMLMRLPYELLGSLFPIEREEYEQLEKQGKTIILMDTLPGNYIRPREFGLDLEGDHYKKLDSLKATLFMSLHIEDMKLINTCYAVDIAREEL